MDFFFLFVMFMLLLSNVVSLCIGMHWCDSKSQSEYQKRQQNEKKQMRTEKNQSKMKWGIKKREESTRIGHFKNVVEFIKTKYSHQSTTIDQTHTHTRVGTSSINGIRAVHTVLLCNPVYIKQPSSKNEQKRQKKKNQQNFVNHIEMPIGVSDSRYQYNNNNDDDDDAYDLKNSAN